MSEDQLIDTFSEIFNLVRGKLDNPKSIYSLNDKFEDHPTLPSGIKAIDECLNGGLPEGKLIEIFGDEGSGKTTLTLHFIAEAQRLGHIVYFIDAEHALDYQYAQRIGVDFDKLMFSQPDTGEEALETVRCICEATEDVEKKTGQRVKSLVVVDSIPALIPKEIFTIYEKDGFESSNALGAAARMLSTKVPMVVNRASKAGVTVVMINQVRDKIGVTWGAKTTTPGGRTVKFFSSLRLKVTRIGYYDKSGVRSGNRVEIIPVKSKQFPIFNRSAQFIIGQNGVDVYADVIEAAVKAGIFVKSGPWLKYGVQGQEGYLSWRGATDCEKYFDENPEFFKQIQERV